MSQCCEDPAHEGHDNDSHARDAEKGPTIAERERFRRVVLHRRYLLCVPRSRPFARRGTFVWNARSIGAEAD